MAGIGSPSPLHITNQVYAVLLAGRPGSAPRLMVTGRLRIAPAVVGTSSEVLTAEMRRRIRDAWDLEPLDCYGTTEAVIPAASRQGQAGMDVLEDLVVLEVVNRAQPLIRYELSDSVTLAGGPTRSGCRTRASPRSTAAATTSSACRRPAAARSPSTRCGCGRPGRCRHRSRCSRSPGIEREGRHAGKFKLIQTTVRREHAHDRDHASA